MNERKEPDVPKKARDLLDKGLSAMERENYVYAMDMFMAALDMEPRFLQARKLLRAAGIKRFKASGSGAVAGAVAMLTGLPLLISGLIALKSGKHAKALEASEKLLLKDPFNLSFIRLFCKAAEAGEMREEAVHTLALAREHYPENVEIISWLGKLYTSMDRMDEAKECFDRVVALRPHDATAMRALRDAMARDTMSRGGWHEVSKDGGTYRDVIKDVKEVEIREQEEKAVKVESGVELLIRESESKLKETPDNANERRRLANLYVQAGRFDSAVRVLEEGRAIAGTADPAIDQLLSSVRLKQFDRDIAQARKKGDDAAAASVEAQKKEFVFNDVQSRVKRYPNDLSLRYEYGMLLYEQGKINEAIQQFQMAERNPSMRVRSLYHIAMCFKAKQQFDLARDQLEKAASGIADMDELKKDIYYQLGQVSESMGDMEQAVNKYYKAIYQADIGYKDVAEKIENAYKHRESE